MVEIFKPAPSRIYGYYYLPVLAGERRIARFALKAQRERGLLRVLSCHFEGAGDATAPSARDGQAAWQALSRYADAVGLTPNGWRPATVSV